jgi:hypothetical protein
VTTAGLGLDITTEAAALLDATVDHFQQAAVALPERQHLVAGDPRQFAWDCEQLTVSMQGIGWGPATSAAPQSPRTGAPASVSSVRHVVLAVTLVRCTPQMTDDSEPAPPSAEELDAAGRAFMRDAGLLSQAIARYVSDATRRLDRVASVEAGVVEPLGPNATHHGLEGTLAITIGKLV